MFKKFEELNEKEMNLIKGGSIIIDFDDSVDDIIIDLDDTVDDIARRLRNLR